MAVLPMKRISLFGLKQNRKAMLELLQRRGTVEIAAVPQAQDLFTKMDTGPAKSTFESSLKTLETAVSVLDELSRPEKSMFAMLEGREPVGVSTYDSTAENSAETIKAALRIVSLSKKSADLKADIIRYQASVEALKPWMGLDISMRSIGTASTSIFIGTLPDDYDEERLKTELAAAVPDVPALEVQVISHSTQQSCIFVLCHGKYGMKVESALRNMGLSYPADPSKAPPSERVKELSQRIDQANKEIEEANKEIISHKERRKEFLYTIDYLTMRLEKYDVLGQLWQSRHIFVVSGFIPAEDMDKLKAELEATYTCFVEFDEPSEEDDVPVKLKNNGFAAPVESVVESYSLPGRGEIDPSSVMAVFYYVLFGMMLSDAAYGLITVIGCGIILLKFKGLEGGLKKALTMFFYCGISTTFWGFMFGSFFGDAITVISRTYFGTEIATPCLWFGPLDDPMRLLMFSFLLGIIHLFTGLAMKLYVLCKNKLYLDALFDVGFWYMLVGGGILYLLSTQMFSEMTGIGFVLPAAVGTVSAIFAGIGALGIILTSGRESKSPGKRLLKGIYGLYGVSSYLSDILSYSRLLALGLATGVIATVFNQMGEMVSNGVGDGIIGFILFMLVFVVGHTLNIGINLLGAYVHTNRLQFVEFFGKFYDGGGRKFNPFSAKTKYFKITEEK